MSNTASMLHRLKSGLKELAPCSEKETSVSSVEVEKNAEVAKPTLSMPNILSNCLENNITTKPKLNQY